MSRWPSALASVLLIAPAALAEGPKLAPGVRGLVTRATGPMKVDGRVDEWAGAFVTPVHYNHARLLDRAAQFAYAWDDSAFYVGLRCLDTRRANVGVRPNLWDGDSVEFYLDTRPPGAIRGKDWTDGAIHFFYTPYEGAKLAPRWSMRAGIATSGARLDGVELAATDLPGGAGYEVELMIPWANFPGFSPGLGALIAADAELCSGDGAGRTDRTFAYGSPLSVQQPASQGLLELVGVVDPSYLAQVGPATFPLWVETPWTQPTRAVVKATLAIPPAYLDTVGRVEVRLHDPDGRIVRTVPAAIETFGPAGLNFARAVASWPIDDFAPGSYFASAQVITKTGVTLATVTPRMVEEAQMSGR